MRKFFTRAIALPIVISIVIFGGCGTKKITGDNDFKKTSEPSSAVVSNVSSHTTSNASKVTSKKEESKVELTSSVASKVVSSAQEKQNVSSKQEKKETNVSSNNEVIEYDVIYYDEAPNETISSKAEEEATTSKVESIPAQEKVDTDNDIDKETEVEVAENISSTIAVAPVYSASDLQFSGVIYWGGWRWTWYSQNVLPGPGLVIPGRHVDENGYVCDSEDNICLAASSLSKGTVVDTPFGKQGKVYDCGCAYGTLDVYTNF